MVCLQQQRQPRFQRCTQAPHRTPHRWQARHCSHLRGPKSLTPWVHQLAQASYNSSKLPPAPAVLLLPPPLLLPLLLLLAAASAGGRYTEKHSPTRLSMTVTPASPATLACCVKGHHSMRRASPAAACSCDSRAWWASPASRTSRSNCGALASSQAARLASISPCWPPGCPAGGGSQTGKDSTAALPRRWRWMAAVLAPACPLPLELPSIKTTRGTEWPLRTRLSYADRVAEMPPSRPSPTRMPGRRSGRSRSHCAIGKGCKAIVLSLSGTFAAAP